MTTIARRDKLMSADELSDYLGVPVATLYQWRHKGTGPTAFRVGRHLRYDPANVRSWLDAQTGARHGPR
jgi:excisionase family DNA binding protein